MAVRSFELPKMGIRWPRLRALYLWHWVVLAVVAVLVGTPIIFLVLGSFSMAPLPGDFTLARMGTENYITVWLDPVTYSVVYNTFVYVTGATAFGLTVAAVLAWLVERTNIPGKIWIYAGVPMTLAMPGMLQAMAWVLLLSPRIGFLNKWAMTNFGLETAPIDIYSIGGMVFIEGLRLVPTAFLMLVPLLRSMDPALEEAAAMSGAKPGATMRRVTIRLMMPGLMAVLIYQAMTALEVFEVPGVLGMPADIFVFSTKIYQLLNSATFLPHYGQANALAMVYVLIAVVAIWLYSRVIARSERYSIITGKGYRPRLQDLGSWRHAAVGLVVLFLMFSIIMPFFIFVYVSFLPYLKTPGVGDFEIMTLDNYREVFDSEMIGTVLKNTGIMVVVTSTVTTLVAFLISLIVVRSRFWGRKILDQLSFVPHAIPGIVLGLALMWVFLQFDKQTGIPLFGTIWAIIIAFMVSFMAYGTRAMNAAILQIHKDLEEAAYVSGAKQWRTMWRIFYPLMMPTFVGVWVWVMLHAVRQASIPLIIYEDEANTVLAVLIWYMWDEGEVMAVGAIGAMLILALLAVTLGLRLIGFGRESHIQQS